MSTVTIYAVKRGTTALQNGIIIHFDPSREDEPRCLSAEVDEADVARILELGWASLTKPKNGSVPVADGEGKAPAKAPAKAAAKPTAKKPGPKPKKLSEKLGLGDAAPAGEAQAADAAEGEGEGADEGAAPEHDPEAGPAA
jgi:hypothetical protein